MYYVNPSLALDLYRLEQARRERQFEIARLLAEAGLGRPNLARRALSALGNALIILGERLRESAESLAEFGDGGSAGAIDG